MLENITIGQYFPGNSSIHRLDPRTKILLSLAFIILIFMIKTYIGYLIVAGYVAMCIAASRLPVKYIFKGLKPMIYIIALTFLMNIFFSAGETVLWKISVFGWFTIRFTQEGLTMAIFMAFRLTMLLCSTQVLTLTTSPLDLTDGIEHLLTPLKAIRFPAHELAMMMTIALRFIPTLLSETSRIMQAQISRGADFESGNLLKRAKSLIPILVPLFVSAFRRADELALAMESRCYRGGENRTRMKQLSFSKLDLNASIFSCIIFVLMVTQGRLW